METNWQKFHAPDSISTLVIVEQNISHFDLCDLEILPNDLEKSLQL